MRVLILNQYNSDNIGDKLIGRSLLDFFINKGVDASLGGFAQMTFQPILHSESTSVFLRNIKRKCPSWLKYILLYKRQIKNEAKRCRIDKVDAMIIGGGQLVKHHGVFPYCFRDWTNLAMTYNIPLYIYGVGADGHLDQKDISLYKKGLSCAKIVSCRDEQSSTILRKIISREINTWPDVVFTLGSVRPAAKNNNILLMPYCYDTAHYHFNSVGSRVDYYKDLAACIQSKEYNELYLSATTSSDLDECYWFGKYLDEIGISYQIVQVQNADELIKLYSNVRKIYSGRMHALIVGLLCGIDVQPIVVSSKISDFRENYLDGKDGCADSVDLSKEGLCWLYAQMINNG